MPRFEGRPFNKDSNADFPSQPHLGGGGAATEKPKKLSQLDNLKETVQDNMAIDAAAREVRTAGIAESMKLDRPEPVDMTDEAELIEPPAFNPPYPTFKERRSASLEKKAVDMTDEAELIEPPAFDNKKILAARLKDVQAQAQAKKEQQNLAAAFNPEKQPLRPVIVNPSARRDRTVRTGGPVEIAPPQSVDQLEQHFMAAGDQIDTKNKEAWQGADGIIHEIGNKFGIKLDAAGNPLGLKSKLKMKLQKKNPELQNMLISLQEALNPGTESTGEILPATPGEPAPNPVRRVARQEIPSGYAIAPSNRTGETLSTQTSDLGLTVDPVSGEKTLQHLMNEAGAAPADNPSPSLSAETQATMPTFDENQIKTEPVMPALPPQEEVHTEPNLPAFAKDKQVA